ncbi:MAG: hypothetical protein RBT51_07170 [Ectothiorhodospiraceae bacterium]|nr:hypothetical protein [Ectothiorhodospiraceae bacterium]
MYELQLKMRMHPLAEDPPSGWSQARAKSEETMESFRSLFQEIRMRHASAQDASLSGAATAAQQNATAVADPSDTLRFTIDDPVSAIADEPTDEQADATAAATHQIIGFRYSTQPLDMGGYPVPIYDFTYSQDPPADLPEGAMEFVESYLASVEPDPRNSSHLLALRNPTDAPTGAFRSDGALWDGNNWVDPLNPNTKVWLRDTLDEAREKSAHNRQFELMNRGDQLINNYYNGDGKISDRLTGFINRDVGLQPVFAGVDNAQMWQTGAYSLGGQLYAGGQAPGSIPHWDAQSMIA